jgi:S-phase kinase-associated protein 1
MKIEEIVQPWYHLFVDVDELTLFELLLAANYMDVAPLVDLAWLAVAIIIKVGCVLWCLSLW